MKPQRVLPSVRLLSVAEVAATLGISEDTVYRLFRSGELASLKIGRRRLVKAVDLVAFVECGIADEFDRFDRRRP